MSRPTYMTIDLTALQSNLARVREYAPNQSIIAMVKANAYGHGIERIAPALTTVEVFGVASIEEALKLRELQISRPIILMEGVFSFEELEEAARNHFTLVVHHLPHIEMLEKFNGQAKGESFSIWLKINTGMHRLGIQPHKISTYYQRLLQLNVVKKPIGFMTHFAEADILESDATNKQATLFNKVTKGLIGPKSLANSAGLMAYPQLLGDYVRPGLMLYGASPFSQSTGQDFHLKPVMTLGSRLIAITEVEKGGKVGYGGTWIAPENMRVGIVGVGYGDGYPQFAQSGTPILVNGVICPLIGRVSMDMLTVDLRPQIHAHVGDPVILWGEGLPVEWVARTSQTSAWEILTRMTPRPKITVKHINNE